MLTIAKPYSIACPKMNKTPNNYKNVNQLLKCLSPALVLLKYLGLFPVTFIFKGELRFKLISFSMVYCVMIYVTNNLSAIVGFVPLINTIASSKNTLTFDQRISILELIMYMIFTFIVPIVTWVECSNLIQYFTKWKKFQISLENLIGISLNLRVYRTPFILTLTSSILPLAVEIFYHIVYLEETVFHVILLAYLEVILTMMLASLCLFWYSKCHVLCDSADIMLTSFRKDIIRFEFPVYTFVQYRSVWLQLSRLTQDIGCTFSYTYCGYIIFVLANLAKNLYVLLYYLTFTNPIWIIWSTVKAIYHCITMFMIFDFGQRIYKKVGQSFEEELLHFGVTGNFAVDAQALCFMRTIERYAPIVNLNGFTVVNRGVLTSLAGMLVTYLVVLVQFDKRLL